MNRSSFFRFSPRLLRSPGCRSALCALAIAGAGVTMSSVACAHALPVTRDPAPGAQVSAPADVTIRFTEPLEPAFSKLTLSDDAGKPVATGASSVDTHDHHALHLALNALVPGRYTVHWVAVADDGHRTQGEYAFIVK